MGKVAIRHPRRIAEGCDASVLVFQIGLDVGEAHESAADQANSDRFLITHFESER